MTRVLDWLRVAGERLDEWLTDAAGRDARAEHLLRLKWEMEDREPKYGGSIAEYVAARDRYLAAKDSTVPPRSER